jgi:hypothetical protein
LKHLGTAIFLERRLRYQGEETVCIVVWMFLQLTMAQCQQAIKVALIKSVFVLERRWTTYLLPCIFFPGIDRGSHVGARPTGSLDEFNDDDQRRWA